MSFWDALGNQLGSGGILGQVISFIVLIIFITFYSRIAVQQIMFKLEKSAIMLEEMSDRAEKIVIKKINRKSDRKLKEKIRSFLEFFVVPPVDIDPHGVMKKLEHIIDLEKYRFKYFVSQIAPKVGKEEQANIMMGLSGAMNLYQIKKIVRHFVELIKQTKSINLAFLIQMQLPFIERLSKALLRGTEALTNGWPIGDGIGPYVAASLTEGRVEEIDEDTVLHRKKIKKRDVIVMKAKGPGGRTGNPGKVLAKLARKEKIAKIITIDASAKLEGEKTGTTAEGVGIAMGGIGVERYQLEEVAVRLKVPMDSVVVKMSAEEAIMPMREAIWKAAPGTIGIVEEMVNNTKGSGKIVIIGVGNTCGVGNDKKSLLKAENIIKTNVKKMKMEVEKEKKKFRFKLPDFGF